MFGETQQMQTKPHWIVWVGVALAATALGASSEEPSAPTKTKLPEPLSGVSTNVGDLALTGYFEVSQAEFGRTKKLDEEALLWTVKVVKPLTCRHAISLLHSWSNGRFYRALKKSRLELRSVELHYPNWIDYGAVNQQILRQDQEFQVWILVNAGEVTNLRLRQADTLEFTRLRR
jgi:hypothetical protein